MTDAPQQPPSEQPPSEPGSPRNLWLVVAVGLGVVVLAVILFILLRPDDSEPAADTSTPAQTTTTVETTTEATTEVTTTVQTTTEQTTTTEPADQAVRVRIRVENAQPVGGVQDHEVAEGDEVLLVVTSDVADEVHLHGYDLPAAVAPGQPARIRFDANLVGEFEIELEERGVPIGNLVVS
jgi:cytoskeletal protein RodZ